MAAIPNEARNPQAPPDGWLTRVEAARKCGVSTKQLERWQSEGTVRGVEHGGRWFYDPGELPDQPAVKEGETIRALVTAIREAHEHAQRCNETLLRGFDSLSLENQRRAEYAKALEETIRSQNELVDKMLSADEERRQSRVEHEARVARGKEAFSQLMRYAPSVADALAFRFVPESRAVQETHLADMLEGLPDEAIEALRVAGYLKPEQLAVLADLRRKLKEQRQRAELKAADVEPAGDGKAA